LEREFPAEGVLITLKYLDFAYRDIEFVSETVDLRAASQKLEAHITIASGRQGKLWIDALPVDQPHAAKSVTSANTVANALVVQSGARAVVVTEHQLIRGFVLDAQACVNYVITPGHAGAKVGDGRGEIRSFVAQRLICANPRILALSSNRSGLLCGADLGAPQHQEKENNYWFHESCSPKS
jgi:hypothetical protein